MFIPKCPRCGSTSQVRIIDVHEWSIDGIHFSRKEVYECGCGCSFQLKATGFIEVEVLDK